MVNDDSSETGDHDRRNVLPRVHLGHPFGKNFENTTDDDDDDDDVPEHDDAEADEPSKAVS